MVKDKGHTKYSDEKNVAQSICCILVCCYFFWLKNYLGCNLKIFFSPFSKGSIFAVFDSIESAKKFVETLARSTKTQTC